MEQRMIKKRSVFLVFFVVGFITMSFSQEGIKGVRIKQMKNNTGDFSNSTIPWCLNLKWCG